MIDQKQKAEPKQCHYCAANIREVDWKDVNTLRKFLSSYMKIAPRRRSGLCAKHQRKVATAVKRARIMALIPFVPE